MTLVSKLKVKNFGALLTLLTIKTCLSIKKEILNYVTIGKKVPGKVDVLITHGPPHGILDSVQDGVSVGCRHLQKKTAEIKPKFHFFGHVHESSGTRKISETTFSNASLTNKSKNINSLPKEFILKK